MKFEILLDVLSRASNTEQPVRGMSLVRGESWAPDRSVGAVDTESLRLPSEHRQRRGLRTEPWCNLMFRSWEAKKSQ